MASAGFVTAVLDKPVWNTTDINRDYPASAKAYDQVIEYLRDQSDVDEAKVGIYATSESTWISSYLLEDDPDIAFQILLSPMVFSPRQSLGFFVTQDFTLVGANEGYQSIVQRVFSADTGLFGLNNFDLATLKPAADVYKRQIVDKAAAALGVDGVTEDDVRSLADLNANTVNNVIFTQRKGKKGYDERQVDYFLNACVQLLSRLESYARVADFVSGEPAAPAQTATNVTVQANGVSPLFASGTQRPATDERFAPAAVAHDESFDALHQAEHCLLYTSRCV